MADYWLSYWVNLNSDERDDSRNIMIYCILVGTFVILGFSRTFAFMAAAIRVSFFVVSF